MGVREQMGARMAAVAASGGVLIQIVWQAEEKTWRVVGSLHSSDGKRVRAISRTVENTGAPDMDDLVRLVGAIQRECESWLW